ncbi:hypothetical protein PGT21_001925 [Puccinia graminis f. sp. tritici]|uniref:Uncharacterized protein n=1 Tax=Puccinia graminis f. sp. tritici TaxID=56615 RepID=A0A5B0QTB7_PUCGR|nr:hypothetical protein PGT21_001925 [Puccinia graminis f. sp. tritici]
MSDIEGILLRLGPSVTRGHSHINFEDLADIKCSYCLWELAGNLPLGNFAVAIEIYSKLKTGKPSEAGDRSETVKQYDLRWYPGTKQVGWL